jgi:hypothetical protein
MHKSPDPFVGCVIYPDGMATSLLKDMIKKTLGANFEMLITAVPRPLLTFSRPLHQQIYPQPWRLMNSVHQQGLRGFS